MTASRTFKLKGVNHLLLLGFLGAGLAGTAILSDAQESWAGERTVEFSASTGSGSPTFQAAPQPVEVKEAMGAVLVTADSFRLLTNLTESRLAGCRSTRPDLPDAQIIPEELADRIGSLNFAVFQGDQTSFTFRTTNEGTEYSITMSGFKPGDVQIMRMDSGELLLTATGAPLNIIRDRAETFICDAAADFTIKLAP